MILASHAHDVLPTLNWLHITLLIGAVILGGMIVTLLNRFDQRKLIKIMLAFSGGFLLSIAFIHFLPELYASHSAAIGLYILIGFLVQLFLEYFSGGIEHGHIHAHKDKAIPIVLFVSLSIHSFIEGIPLAMPEVQHEGHTHLSSDSLLMGILFHQTPVAIALMTLLLNSSFTKAKSWIILILFSLMTPLGLLFGYFSQDQIAFLDMDKLLAVVVGMFLHISTTIIFESTENHRFNFVKLISILVGVSLALAI